jgi:hypothetical protein
MSSLAFARFMANPVGRIVRIVAGLALIAVGLFVIKGTTGIIVTIIGVAFVLLGLANVCVIAAIIGAPFRGQDAARGQ